MKLELTPWQAAAVFNPFDHFAMVGGVATGKTYTGSRFAIRMFTEHPSLPGFIGANTYDQLSQATLAELFLALETYGWDYTIDCAPPREWGVNPKKFKKWSNILTVKNPVTGDISHAFTRVLSDPNPLRGIQFGWYWLDESRDTPMNTHDVVLSRLRSSKTFRKGLVTTTPNGDDWVLQRFIRKQDPDFGSLHVKTIESVKAGIISKKYYDTMRATYSELMALQELDAEHVNVLGGQAYYAFREENRKRRAPWGDDRPDPTRPLIVGCDFNYAPAPLIWMVGQLGPPVGVNPENGYDWRDHIHWYKNLKAHRCSSREMAKILMNQYPDFAFLIFGDASGERGTTSNAGEVDYDQMAEEFDNAGYVFSIDVDQNNPRVRDRVEVMNGLGCNSMGQRRMTYDPTECDLLDGDIRMVGWKQNITQGGHAMLDDGGDKDRTHASDGAGYAVWKLFPPGRRVAIQKSIPSAVRSGLEDVL